MPMSLIDGERDGYKCIHGKLRCKNRLWARLEIADILMTTTREAYKVTQFYNIMTQNKPATVRTADTFGSVSENKRAIRRKDSASMVGVRLKRIHSGISKLNGFQ